MQRAIIPMHFPQGKLPASGWRCAACGEESLSAPAMAELQDTARRLGLYGPESERRRRLQRSGTSTVVTLDPAFLADALGGAGPGDEVLVARQGDAIVIRRAPAKG
jgi:hypothetical protein